MEAYTSFSAKADFDKIIENLEEKVEEEEDDNNSLRPDIDGRKARVSSVLK